MGLTQEDLKAAVLCALHKVKTKNNQEEFRIRAQNELKVGKTPKNELCKGNMKIYKSEKYHLQNEKNSNRKDVKANQRGRKKPANSKETNRNHPVWQNTIRAF